VKRILVYSHDTFGLGNIRRMLTIAQHLAESDPEVSVLIVSGSPMLHAFRIPPRVDYVKLPCLSRTLKGSYSVKFLDMPFEDTIRLRANILVSTLLDFAPDVVVVDKKPFGVSNELAPALELLQRRGSKTKLVLLLRDILDSPAATQAVWQKNRYFDAIAEFYHQVLVVGSRELFDITEEYAFPAGAADKVRFCGYLRRQRSAVGREEQRARLGVGEERLVLVTPGGGEDGARLIASHIEAWPHVAARTNASSLVVCGPEMAQAQREKLHAAAAGQPRIKVMDFSDDMIGLMDAADVVVSMSGYNTVCELLTLKKRAILVPRVKPVQEQLVRAERLAQLGLARTLHPDALAPALMAQTLVEELDLANVHQRGLYQIDMDGLSRIGDAIAELLEPSESSDEPVTARWALSV
jgi:predicted glycosyltransferase